MRTWVSVEAYLIPESNPVLGGRLGEATTMEHMSKWRVGGDFWLLIAAKESHDAAAARNSGQQF